MIRHHPHATIYSQHFRIKHEPACSIYIHAAAAAASAPVPCILPSVLHHGEGQCTKHSRPQGPAPCHTAGMHCPTFAKTSKNKSRFRLMSDKTFRSMQHRLHQPALHQGRELKVKEQDFGFKYIPHSWLQDTELDVRPMRVLAFDWMHCWCEKGVWDKMQFSSPFLHRHPNG